MFTKFCFLITKLTEEIKKTQDWKPIHFVASVRTADDIPKTPKEGGMYNIDTDSVYGAAGMNVVWTADGWNPMGPIIDLTPYLTKTEAEKLFQPKGEYLTAAEEYLNRQRKVKMELLTYMQMR